MSSTELLERQVLERRQALELAEAETEVAKRAFVDAVADYLDAGGKAPDLAASLGVSRGRIYQYRDHANGIVRPKKKPTPKQTGTTTA